MILTVCDAWKLVKISTVVIAQGTALYSANGLTRSPFLNLWLSAKLPTIIAFIAVFAGIDNCKFKNPITPGDKVRLETKITQVRGPVGVGEALATVDGQVAVKCTLKFAILV